MYPFIRSIVLLLLFSIVTGYMINLGIQDSNRFGPYHLSYTRFDMCMGPKSKNLTRMEVTLGIVRSTYYGHFNVTFLSQTHVDQVKIVVYSLKNGNKSNVLWTYRFNDPCKHYAFAAIINTYYDAVNCVVNKGTYIQDINFEELQTIFFGTSFFYGEYLFKSTVVSKKGNLLCLYMGVVFTKKSKSKN